MFGSERILLWRWCTFDAIWVFDVFLFYFFLLFGFWLPTNIPSMENIIKNKERGRFTLYLCPNTSSTLNKQKTKKRDHISPIWITHLNSLFQKQVKAIPKLETFPQRRWNLEIVLFCKSVCGCFLYNASPSLTWMKWIFTYFHLHGTNRSLFFCRFSFSRKISLVVVYFHIFSTCYNCTSSISYFMCSGGWEVEYSRCLVGKANWTDEVRLILSCIWFFILLYLATNCSSYNHLAPLWCMLKQVRFLEVSRSNLFLGHTTISGFCCFYWNPWGQFWSDPMSSFILGTSLIIYRTNRYLTSQ